MTTLKLIGWILKGQGFTTRFGIESQFGRQEFEAPLDRDAIEYCNHLALEAGLTPTAIIWQPEEVKSNGDGTAKRTLARAIASEELPGHEPRLVGISYDRC